MFTDDTDAAGPGVGHDEEGFLHGHRLQGEGVLVAAAHDVAHAQKQGAADGAGGMVPGEVMLLEPARVS